MNYRKYMQEYLNRLGFRNSVKEKVKMIDGQAYYMIQIFVRNNLIDIPEPFEVVHVNFDTHCIVMRIQVNEIWRFVMAESTKRYENTTKSSRA
ncbi:MAG: hypothetical protein HC831_08280 [Chloroflexia bacterium]|nr:hypothetical protein [Chloroflexia bacterium]